MTTKSHQSFPLMLNGLALLLVAASLVPSAQAQISAGPYEVFAGYSYLYANPGDGADRFGMHGGHVEVFFPIRGAFGPVLDLSAHFGVVDVASADGSENLDIEVGQFAFLFGGRYAGLRSGRLAAALEATAGVTTGRVSDDLRFRNLGIESTALAAALGGSLSYDVSDRLALRVQPTLFLTTFDGAVQANGRYSVGLAVRFP